MTIRRELIDELLKDYPNPQDVLAEDGLLKQLTKAVIERCLETELDAHLGYPKHRRQGHASGNTRHPGATARTLWRGGLADVHLEGDRGSHGGGPAVAKPPAGDDLPHGLSGLPGGQREARTSAQASKRSIWRWGHPQREQGEA